MCTPQEELWSWLMALAWASPKRDTICFWVWSNSALRLEFPKLRVETAIRITEMARTKSNSIIVKPFLFLSEFFSIAIKI